MARKNRNLASFDDVASTNKNVIANDNINEKMNDNTNKESNDNMNENVNVNNSIDNNINVNDIVNKDDSSLDYLDKLIVGNTKKQEANSTVLTGIYLQKDLAKILDQLGKKGGRGAKSRIVNEALRSVFMEKGLL